MAALKLTTTKPHRVINVGCSYLLPTVGYDEKGQEAEVMAHHVGHNGEEIQLTEPQARRLIGLGSVVPADEPLGYREQTSEKMTALAAERGITVAGTGANGEVQHDDLVTALENYDSGQRSKSQAMPSVTPAPTT